MIRGRPLDRDRILRADRPQCSSGKDGWPTRDAALAARRSTDLDVHRCRACGCWHHTGTARPRRRSALGNLRTGGKMTRNR